MATARQAPFSRYPITQNTAYPMFYDPGSGVGVRRMLGMGIGPSITLEASWGLFWAAPLVIPSGTMKLELWSRANAVSGVARVNPRWAGVAMGQNPGAIAPVAEGTQSITWSAADVIIQTKIILDASTLTAGQVLEMVLAFDPSGFTLAVESCHWAWLIWE